VATYATLHAGLGARGRSVLGRDWGLGWTFLAPVLAILLGLVAYPFVSAIVLSFQDRLLGASTYHWVGLANFVALAQNPLFLTAVVNTIVYTAGAVGTKFVIGLLSAAVLNQDIPLKNFWRGVLFLPWAIPAVVSAYAWRFVFDTNGLFNSLVVQFHLADDYIYFLSNPHLAMISVIVVAIWAGYPFYTMNFLAGMQAISTEMYEAAEIDGAGTLQRYFYITLPNLQYVIFITVLLSTIWTSSNLAQILVLTYGGPENATMTLPLLAYITALPSRELSMGAAISMAMVPAYVVLVIFLTRRMLREE
jgi:multiple sugar transport system permease protein